MKTKIPKALSLGEETLAQQLNALGIKFEREYKFCEDRKWKFDFIVIIEVSYRCFAIEIEGGTRWKSRHTTHKGFEADCEKYNEASIMGWRVLRFTTDMVVSGEAIAVIERAIKI